MECRIRDVISEIGFGEAACLRDTIKCMKAMDLEFAKEVTGRSGYRSSAPL